MNRSVKLPRHLKRQRSIAWHNYTDLRQRNGISSEITGQALLFYDSIDDKYRNDHIHHQIQEKLSLSSLSLQKIVTPIFVAKMLDHLQSDH